MNLVVRLGILSQISYDTSHDFSPVRRGPFFKNRILQQKNNTDSKNNISWEKVISIRKYFFKNTNLLVYTQYL